MVTPALKSRFEQMGVRLIPIADGARRFVEELAASASEVETIVGSKEGLGAAPERHVTLEVRVNARTHPFVADHRIGGKPVVPVVLAIDWMARAARAVHPEMHVVAIRDVAVLRGIKLDHFDTVGDRFVISARQVSNGSNAILAVQIRSPEGAVHYSASAELAPSPSAGPLTSSRSPTEPRISAWAGGPIYDGQVLFHGPALQVIRSLDGLSDDGGVAMLDGMRAMGWTAPSVSDTALLDGGMQLAALWFKEALGGAALPMAVRAFHLYQPGWIEGAARAVLTGKRTAGGKGVCDVSFAHADGRPIAELQGIEMILRPSGNAAHPSPSA